MKKSKKTKSDFPIEKDNQVEPLLLSWPKKLQCHMARFSTQKNQKIFLAQKKGFKIARLDSQDPLQIMNAFGTIRSCLKPILVVKLKIYVTNLPIWLLKSLKRARRVSIQADTPWNEFAFHFGMLTRQISPGQNQYFEAMRLKLDHFLPVKMNFFTFASREFEFVEKLLRRRHVKVLNLSPELQARFQKYPLNYFPFINSVSLACRTYLPLKQLSKTKLQSLKLNMDQGAFTYEFLQPFLLINTNQEIEQNQSSSLAKQHQLEKFKDLARFINLQTLELHFDSLIFSAEHLDNDIIEIIEGTSHCKRLRTLKLIDVIIEKPRNILQKITERLQLDYLEIKMNKSRAKWEKGLFLLFAISNQKHNLLNIRKLCFDFDFSFTEMKKLDFEKVGTSLEGLFNLISLRLILPFNLFSNASLITTKVGEISSLRKLELDMTINTKADDSARGLLNLLNRCPLEELNLSVNKFEHRNSKDFVEFIFFEELLKILSEKKAIQILALELGKLKNRKKNENLGEKWKALTHNLINLQHVNLKLSGQDYFLRDEAVPFFEGFLSMSYLRVLKVSLQLMYASLLEKEKVVEVILNHKMIRVEELELILSDCSFSRKLGDLAHKREDYHKKNLLSEQFCNLFLNFGIVSTSYQFQN